MHLYAACWNEIGMVEWFLRHYDPWVERYVIFDDGSTDGSPERLAEHPRVELRRFERTHPDSLVLSLLELYDNGWKESRGKADWVVVVNLDEHLHHPDPLGYLDRCARAGVTAIPALGYQMVSETAPPPEATLTEAVRLGVPWRNMSKLALFDPNAIDEIAYAVGRHSAAPTGRVVYPDRDELVLLHFKCLGVDWVDGRHAEQRTRLGTVDRSKGYGHRYLFERSETEEWLSGLHGEAVEALAAREHPEPRWWR